ncbi:Uncharacterised protein [Prevotella intermedia]|nr:Uncharacterised protein [Prevotella intermedia]
MNEKMHIVTIVSATFVVLEFFNNQLFCGSYCNLLRL